MIGDMPERCAVFICQIRDRLLAYSGIPSLG